MSETPTEETTTPTKPPPIGIAQCRKQASQQLFEYRALEIVFATVFIVMVRIAWGFMLDTSNDGWREAPHFWVHLMVHAAVGLVWAGFTVCSFVGLAWSRKEYSLAEVDYTRRSNEILDNQTATASNQTSGEEEA